MLALYEALDASRPTGVVDLVPAARTIGVTVDTAVLPLSAVHGWLTHTEPVGPASAASASAPAPRRASTRRTVEIPVRYDGEDLAEVAALLGMPVAEVVALHTSSRGASRSAGSRPASATSSPTTTD